MERKRVNFGEEEKIKIRMLVTAKKDIAESKKSDFSSLAEKKKAWSDITEDFNSSGQFPFRSTVQLKKLWENIKARRKALLNEEKRSRFRTGGGSGPLEIPEDPELDMMGVDIEIPGAMDSDTARLHATPTDEVSLLHMEHAPQEVCSYEEVEVTDCAAETSLLAHVSPITPAVEEGEIPLPPEIQEVQRKRRTTKHDEITLRAIRNEDFLAQSRELHLLKVEEHKKKIELADLQIDLVKKQIKQAEDLHASQMRKVQLEIDQIQ